MQQHYLVPEHGHDTGIDIHYSSPANSVEDAEDAFVAAKDKLLDVNSWHKYIGTALQLTDAHGNFLHRNARKGDQIIVAGNSNHQQLTIEAEEYDDYPDENRETFAMHIAFTWHPLSSATFVIERDSCELIAYYHKRSDKTDVALTRKEGEIQVPDSFNAWQNITDDHWSSLLKGLLIVDDEYNH